MIRRPVRFKQAETYLGARQDKPTYLKAKEYLTTWDAETRRKSFFSARVASADILSELHKAAQDVVSGKATEEQAAEWMRDLLDRNGAGALEKMGFSRAMDAGNRLTELASERRLRLIMYQNVKIAQETGQYEMWAANKDRYPYGRWRLGHSEEHRPEHVQRDGKIYPFDHPIWRQSPPGSEFNCHCWREELTAEEARGLPIEAGGPVERPTVDFDPGRRLDTPPPVKAETPPAIAEALREDLGAAPPPPHPDSAPKPPTPSAPITPGDVGTAGAGAIMGIASAIRQYLQEREDARRKAADESAASGLTPPGKT